MHIKNVAIYTFAMLLRENLNLCESPISISYRICLFDDYYINGFSGLNYILAKDVL